MILDHKRILVVKPSSLGDVVHTLPLIHAMKRHAPTCSVGWIVERGFMGVLEHDPAVDEIIPIHIPSTSDPAAPRGAFLAATVATARAIRVLRSRFRSQPYDIILDLHASFRSGLLALANPNGRRIGLSDAKELNSWFQHECVPVPTQAIHAVDKNLLFAGHLGFSMQPGDFRVSIGEQPRRAVADFLTSNGVSDTDRVIYGNPVARWATKMWTEDAWAALGNLVADHPHLVLVLGGGPGDLSYIRAVADRMSRKPLISAGRLDLAASAALLERSDAYVGVDSGPMHIAAFVGTPVVALFGPTDPVKVGPYGQGHRVVRVEDLPCLACRKRSCDDRRCFEELAPERVFREVLSVLGSPSLSCGTN